MVLQLDHVVIAVLDLDRAIDDYHALGFTVRRGGVHANRATHNALISFADGVYLELLAATGEKPLPDHVDFSAMLAGGEGLAGFALRGADLVTGARRLREAGFRVGAITEGAREKDGRLMRWKLALIDGGFAPFLIEDVTPRAWRVPDDTDVITHANHAVGVAAVEIVARDFDAARQRYARLTGAHQPDAVRLIQLPAGDSDRVQAMSAALGDRDEALFAIHLRREDTPHETFPLARTHGARVEWRTGAPPTRG